MRRCRRALGLWAALDAHGSSEVLEPPCAERAGEVAEGAELSRRQLREMSYAPTRVECERLRDEYVSDLRAMVAQMPPIRCFGTVA